MTLPIRYIALDFDNCICEVNDAFRIVWDFYEGLVMHSELKEYWCQLRELWIHELDKSLSDGKLHFLNDDVMMLLKHVEYGDLEVKPEVFVYTNNTNEELIRFLGSVIEKNMRLKPWTRAFFAQDSRRVHEFSAALAFDEPGKSFEGMKMCMGNPEDMTPETLLFLDDLLHPIRKTLGDQYIHIQPPFKSKDKLLPYLETFIKAIQKLEPTLSIENSIELRIQLRNFLYTKSSHLEYFPAPRDMYKEWNLQKWNDFFTLFHPFGSEEEEEEEEKKPLDAYYKCRDHLTRSKGASSS
jgi:hypothetical protein